MHLHRLILRMVVLTNMGATLFHLALIVASKIIWLPNFGSNLAKLAFAQPPMTTLPTTSLAPSQVLVLTLYVTMTFVEYDALYCASGTGVSTFANLASRLPSSTLGIHTLLTFSSTPWIIDSGASTHMTRTPTILSSYQLTLTYPLVTIVDGWTCLVKSHRTTSTSPSLSLNQVLYILDFSVNLLSISVITRVLYTIIFFPFHYIFQDLHTRWRIGLGCENGQMSKNLFLMIFFLAFGLFLLLL